MQGPRSDSPQATEAPPFSRDLGFLGCPAEAERWQTPRREPPPVQTARERGRAFEAWFPAPRPGKPDRGTCAGATSGTAGCRPRTSYPAS